VYWVGNQLFDTMVGFQRWVARPALGKQHATAPTTAALGRSLRSNKRWPKMYAVVPQVGRLKLVFLVGKP